MFLNIGLDTGEHLLRKFRNQNLDIFVGIPPKEQISLGFQTIYMSYDDDELLAKSFADFDQILITPSGNLKRGKY